MTQSIGPNTNAPPDIISSDCVILAGEDAASSEPLLRRHFGEKQREHAFRSYIFQQRPAVTTIISGMGTGCIEPLMWELRLCGRTKRLILAGTAGAMPNCSAAVGQAYIIRSARPAGAGLDAICLTGEYHPRWRWERQLPTATIVSTDFYYGLGCAVLSPDHPLHDTSLPDLFAEAREDLVDMEAACFYALAARFLPLETQFLAIKSPANPAGEGAVHLANTPGAMEVCLQLAAYLLTN